MRPHRTWGCVRGGRSYVYITLTLSQSQSLTLTLTLSCVYMVGRLYYIYIYIHYIQRALLRLSQPLSFSRGATSQHERRLRWWRRSTKVYLQRVTAYLVQDICCVASTLRPAECNSVQDDREFITDICWAMNSCCWYLRSRSWASGRRVDRTIQVYAVCAVCAVCICNHATRLHLLSPSRARSSLAFASRSSLALDSFSTSAIASAFELSMASMILCS